ncbi:uncharacterized protein LOC134848173 [Symsagittifera roscoffensis]|uniref:uncharacterized protein LOC134848173 n=1 Tax=Symsagittifera roscoffensis TaxID=84072 RepID=UPI00307C2207
MYRSMSQTSGCEPVEVIQRMQTETVSREGTDVRARQTLNSPEDRIISYTNSAVSIDPERMRSTIASSFRPDISLGDSDIEIRLNTSGNLERSLVHSVLGEIIVLDNTNQPWDGSPFDEKARLSLMGFDRWVKLMLGWYKLEPGSSSRRLKKISCRLYNLCYPVLVLFLLLSYYILSVVLCIAPRAKSDNSDTSGNSSSSPVYQGCSNIFSNYTLDYIINFFLYLSVFWYTRFHRSESLYIALEKVFMRAQRSQIGKLQTPKFVRKMRLFVLASFIFGAIAWIAMATSYLAPERFKFTFSDQHSKFMESFNKVFKGGYRIAMIAALEVCMVLGCLLYTVVYSVLVLHYFWFCTIIVFDIQCLVSDILQRAVTLTDAIRDVQFMQATVSSLNGFPSKVTAMALLSGVANFTFEMYELSVLELEWYDSLLYRLAMSIYWLFIFSSILLPACIITEHERRLRKAAAEMRAFGYPSAATSDVDSFITYLNIIRIQPKLLYINVHTSWVAGTYVVSFLVIVLLTKTDVLFEYLN